MNEIAVYQQPKADLAVPAAHDFDSWIAVASDVIKLANEIYDTPFVPEGLRGSGPAVAAAILAGRELGIGPMTALQHVHVIKGKPAQSAALMRALIQSAGHQIETVDISDIRAVVKGRRKNESTWEEATFTADQAKRAGIDLGKYPQDKLYARATSRLARRKFADVIAGMPYSAEELEDGPLTDDSAPADVMLADDPGYKADRQAPKPAGRTAQRRTRATADRPTTAAPAAASAPTAAPATAQTAPAASGLPPLPGEEDPTPGPQPATGSTPSTSATDEPDGDAPGTVTTAQLTAIWTIFRRTYKFTDDDKDHARQVAAHITGHPLTSTRDMSKNEAKAVLDTLGNWQAIAKERGEQPRDVLLAMMAAADATETYEADGGDTMHDAEPNDTAAET